MELFQILGLEVPEHLVTFTMELVECLRKHLVLEEQKDQFVKNLIYLVNELLTSTDPNIQQDFNIEKLYAKVSFIGRKLMLDIKTAPDRLEAILCFFSISLELFQQTEHDPESETSPTRLTSFAILNLTQRLATDQQYTTHQKIKETSLTIQDNLQKHLTTPIFVQIYNQVKKEITQKRSERKQKEKRLVTSEAGLRIRQKKRDKKQEKKREKRINKIILSKLNR